MESWNFFLGMPFTTKLQQATHVRQIYRCLSCCNSTSVDIGGRQEGYRRFDSDPRLQNFLNSAPVVRWSGGGVGGFSKKKSATIPKIGSLILGEEVPYRDDI